MRCWVTTKQYFCGSGFCYLILMEQFHVFKSVQQPICLHNQINGITFLWTISDEGSRDKWMLKWLLPAFLERSCIFHEWNMKRQRKFNLFVIQGIFLKVSLICWSYLSSFANRKIVLQVCEIFVNFEFIFLVHIFH
jgi:hypothetical protein